MTLNAGKMSAKVLLQTEYEREAKGNVSKVCIADTAGLTSVSKQFIIYIA